MLRQRIGIDAKWYFEGPPSGKRVVQSLVDNILKIDNDNEYFLFLRKEDRDKTLQTNNKNINFLYVWSGNNLLSNVFVLPWYIKKYKINITLYQNFISPFDSGIALAYIHDVLFLSNPEYYGITERIYFFPLKFVTRFAKAIITISEEEKLRLVTFNFKKNPKDIFVVYHGVDKAFKPKSFYSHNEISIVREKYNLPEKFLLFVGRLNVRKNVGNLLKAIPNLNDKNIPLVIVGPEDLEKANYLKIIDELGIAHRVIFTGFIPDHLEIVYSIATVFCFPSFAEGFGLPALEAMACKVPVVVSNSTCMPEICGDAGVYIKPDDAFDIAEQINKLMENADLYIQHQQLGVNRAAVFTWDAAATKIINIFKQLTA